MLQSYFLDAMTTDVPVCPVLGGPIRDAPEPDGDAPFICEGRDGETTCWTKLRPRPSTAPSESAVNSAASTVTSSPLDADSGWLPLSEENLRSFVNESVHAAPHWNTECIQHWKADSASSRYGTAVCVTETLAGGLVDVELTPDLEFEFEPYQGRGLLVPQLSIGRSSSACTPKPIQQPPRNDVHALSQEAAVDPLVGTAPARPRMQDDPLPKASVGPKVASTDHLQGPWLKRFLVSTMQELEDDQGGLKPRYYWLFFMLSTTAAGILSALTFHLTES